ncbi:MAG: mechanosensitive ion channel domain-containing protein [Gemmatimonadota bacterium]
MRSRALRRRRRPLPNSRHYRDQAIHKLRRFRRASALTVALTGSVLLLVTAPQEATPVSVQESPAVTRGADSAPAELAQDSSATERVQQAARPIQDLTRTAYGALPRLVIAIALFIAAALLSRAARWVLHRILHGWERADALAALLGIGIWILAAGAAISVVAGDFRALAGAVGLFGLALSWSLQTPIESFTGWLLNSFQGYYRVGDRIAVGDVFGDVYAIDVLTTTVWEAGGANKSVWAAQPTGADHVPKLGSAARKHRQLHSRFPLRLGRGYGRHRQRKRPAVRAPRVSRDRRADRGPGHGCTGRNVPRAPARAFARLRRRRRA